MQQKERVTSYKSISRVADILLCLSNGINTVTEIANYQKTSKSTVSRLLQALTRANLTTQDPVNRRYYLGHLITQLLSNPKTTHNNIIMWAIEEMNHLSEISAETLVLSIMIGIQHIRLHTIPSKHVLRVSENDNLIGPQLYGATAKVLLSQLSDQELRIALKNIDINRITGYSATVYREKFISQLDEIRQQGYALTYGERIPGTLGISAPIRYYTCPAALTIMGPENRLSLRISDLVKELKASTNRISSSISEIFQTKEVNSVSSIT